MFGGYAFLVAWSVFCLTMIITGFDFVAAIIAAAAGLAIWLVWSLVYCVLSAVFG